MKIVLPLLGGTFALLLSSCGSCSCNSYDRDLLYDVKPTTSKSF
ncbi:MAG: CGxCxC motif mini-lipoprotein [Akkermansiaceae bacterium]|nr:CGxCxC motif mini-lipoprotein [Akkermansia sp.]MCD7798352.1 CGxCxC motif mini-lipoprotein [Akkermansiaceae bacterium]MCD8069891.1 CGxCxC motif mini-lipoprotein [Akkermansiaceae bacterium]